MPSSATKKKAASATKNKPSKSSTNDKKFNEHIATASRPQPNVELELQDSTAAGMKRSRQEDENATTPSSKLVSSPSENAEAKTVPVRTQTNINGKTKAPRLFIFGNYVGYYGYRETRDQADPRLQLFKRDWFQNKRVLDIGCNDGTITLAIAHSHNPKHILGVDIDSSLIRRARANLRRHASSVGNRETGETYNTVPSESVGPFEFPNNCGFRRENFVENGHVDSLYDTVLCLSTSKWVHLNWGDTGLKRLFKKVHDCLSPGGAFVLEYQEWDSYKKKAKKLTKEIKDNYEAIQIKPEHFRTVLLDEIGFASVQELQDPFVEEAIEQQTVNNASNGKKKGFDRPILLCYKAHNSSL